MKRNTLAIAMAAALFTAACLQKDTTSTIYLRPDGSFDWVILEQNVRSDERDESARLAEEAKYVDAVSGGELNTVNGLLALGAEDVQVRWLRSRRPYAVMIDARFGNLAGVFDRLLAPCEIPYESRLTESEGIATWTLRADVGLDGDRLEQGAGEGCGDGIDGLDGALGELRIILESGSFTAATGFIIKSTDTAAVDEKALEENAKSTGYCGTLAELDYALNSRPRFGIAERRSGYGGGRAVRSRPRPMAGTRRKAEESSRPAESGSGAAVPGPPATRNRGSDSIDRRPRVLSAPFPSVLG